MPSGGRLRRLEQPAGGAGASPVPDGELAGTGLGVAQLGLMAQIAILTDDVGALARRSGSCAIAPVAQPAHAGGRRADRDDDGGQRSWLGCRG